jgi:hypothetical protein
MAPLERVYTHREANVRLIRSMPNQSEREAYEKELPEKEFTERFDAGEDPRR